MNAPTEFSKLQLGALPAPNTTPPRLLVVDDEPTNIQALYQTFRDDHQVLMATDGAQALAVAREKLPDLVLLDVVMPGMSGHEVLTQLKSDEGTRDIPVIFVTAYNDTSSETQGLALGAVDFISKPINPPVVRARVHTHLTLKAQADFLRSMARIDGLTGIYNRRHFDERLDIEFRRAARSQTPLALALLDVDDFKKYNDHYGHLQGDDVLRNVAATLKATLKRPGDLLARYGGEEFVCILPEVHLAAAAGFAQTLVDAVHALHIEHATSRTAAVVTVSLGMSVYEPGQPGSAALLLAAADAALYRAKHEGRARAYVQAVSAYAAPTPPDCATSAAS